MLIELHSHSHYSKGVKVPHEGLNSPKQMVEHAKRIGLGAIAITDHGTLRGANEAARYARENDIIAIPGMEVSVNGRHIIALGISEEVPDSSVRDALDNIRSQGGITIAAHPFDIEGKGLAQRSSLCDAMEVFNALNVERIANMLAWRFQSRTGMPCVAVSDAHSIEMLGRSSTAVNADSLDSVLNAIKHGKTSLVCRYMPSDIILEWSVKRLQLSYDNTAGYMNDNYPLLKRELGKRALSLVRLSPGSIDHLFKACGYAGLFIAVCTGVIGAVSNAIRY